MSTLILLEQILIATGDILCDELSYLDSITMSIKASLAGRYLPINL